MLYTARKTSIRLQPNAAVSDRRTEAIAHDCGKSVRRRQAKDRSAKLIPACSGPNSSGVVGDGVYRDMGWPLGGNDVRLLDDGTFFAAGPDGSYRLGEGHALDRRWTRIEIFPVRHPSA